MEIKRNRKENNLVTISAVPVGSVFTVPSGSNGTLYLRVEFGMIDLTTFMYHNLAGSRDDSCAQVLKATLTVEG